MAFSNYEWIAEGLSKIDELGKRLEKLEAQVAQLTKALEEIRGTK